MPRKSGKSRAQNRGTQEYPGILLDDADSLLRKCSSILREILDQTSGLEFLENRLARGESEYLLTGSPASSAKARARYPVLPFRQSRDRSFWFGASLRFSQEVLRWRLSNVSLLFFQGLVTDPDKEPLLRAEWDTWEGPHAQPHWHVYAPLRQEREFGLALQEPVKEFGLDLPTGTPGRDTDQEATTWDLERFHYAMAARWHIAEVESHSCQIYEESLLKWIEGCIRYTRRQLEYISE